jgi:hypothetical protein
VSFVTQTGMLAQRNADLGIVTYRPATWDVVTSTFGLDCLISRDPDFLDVNYYSGNIWSQSTCPTQMDPFWEQAIAHFAIAEVERNLCACENTEWMFQKWREDLALANDVRTYNLFPSDLINPFGTRWGAIDAWKRVKERGLS